MLRANWREGHRASDGVPYAFTCPATPRYRHQWYWDSCFHAIAWRHFDPARAREELRTLVRAGRLDGFIPHTAFWDRPAYWRRAPFYGTHTVFGASATATIQTPLLALAWELVAAASPDDPRFAADGLPQLRLHYDWLARERDIDGDGLLTIIYPDESGLDDSPKYDDVFGRMRHDSIGYWWLVERYRRLGYDADAIAQRYDEHVEDVLVNVFYASRCGRWRGWTTSAARSGRRGRSGPRRALLERCYDERTGLFFDLGGPGRAPGARSARGPRWRRSRCRECPRTCAGAWSRSTCCDPRRYRAPIGIPSVARCRSPPSTRGLRSGAAGAGRRG